MQQYDEDTAPSELTGPWQELLGQHLTDAGAQQTPNTATIPTLESDPWSALLLANGTRIVDLQQVHLHMSDQDVEQALQIMQEHSAPDTEVL